jgi:hypothetical protein
MKKMAKNYGDLTEKTNTLIEDIEDFLPNLKITPYMAIESVQGLYNEVQEFLTSKIKTQSWLTTIMDPAILTTANQIVSELAYSGTKSNNVIENTKSVLEEVLANLKEFAASGNTAEGADIQDGEATIALQVEGGETVTVNESGGVIGREGNLLQINDKYVSRQHCEVYGQNGKFYVMDLNSMNGTELNGQELEPMKPYPITFGDKISVWYKDITVVSP